MSSVELLQLVVSERLSAAADEIFEAVKKTLAGYEEELLLSKQEIQRQRKILQAVLSPQIKINRLTGLLINAMNSFFERLLLI